MSGVTPTEDEHTYVLKAPSPPQGRCDHLIEALKLVTTWWTTTRWRHLGCLQWLERRESQTQSSVPWDASFVEHARARCPGQTSVRHVLRTYANWKLFGEGSCESYRRASASDELECTNVQEDTRNVRVKCAHVGNRSIAQE